MNGQNMLSNHAISATQGALSNTYTFVMDLPGGECDAYMCTLAPTANRRVLIATQGFAALRLVTPDYVVPNGFLPLGKGSINYASYDFVAYSGLPADGVNAMTRTGAIVPNVATNFAGQSASVNVPGNANYTGLWWASPAGSESGWGINFAHQGDTIFASWFTYDLTGKGLWLVMTAQKSAPNVYSGLLYTTTGPAFNAVPFDPAQVMSTQVGNGNHHVHRRQQREFQLHREGQHANQGDHAPGLRDASDMRHRDGQPRRGHQLPGLVVGGTGGLRVRLGDQSHASERHHIRDVVYL